MIKAIAGVLIGCVIFVNAAYADSAVYCLQEQLLVLGYDPGPIDGQFGEKTATAFENLKAAAPDKINETSPDELTSFNAGLWCAGLAKTFAEAAAAQQKYQSAIEDKTGGFTFDVATNVPPARVAEIKDGLTIARAFIAKTFGSEISAEARHKMIIKIVATGKGNQERGGGNGVATAFAVGYDVPRPFFDVANEQWSQNTQGRGWTTKADNMKAVVHEYTHSWQMMLGAININRQPLGNWMNEGLAEYVAYSAMADAKMIKWRDAQRFMIRAASGAETEQPLKVFGSTQTPAWAGHVGFVAFDWLISDTGAGIGSIRRLAEEVAAGRSQNEAFANVFGLELDDFYGQFEQWRAAIRKDPVRALANRPKLR